MSSVRTGGSDAGRGATQTERREAADGQPVGTDDPQPRLRAMVRPMEPVVTLRGRMGRVGDGVGAPEPSIGVRGKAKQGASCG